MKIAVFFPKAKSSMLVEILSGTYPDKLSGLSCFNEFDMKYELFDPLPLPLNPASSMHSLYSGIDPLRSFFFLFKKNKFDIILCVGESSALCFIVWQKLFRIKLPPIVIWDPALTLEWKNRVTILNYTLPNVAHVAVLGENQQKFIDTHIGRCCTSVLPHWIDCDYFSPNHCTHESSKRFILAVGDDVSRDYTLLEESSLQLEIDIIILSRKFKPKASTKNLTVISKFLSFSALRQLYHDALFVVIPLKNVYHAGGINAIQEAMAMQKATIVSNSEGVREYILDSTSIIVAPNSRSELSAALLLLQQDEILRKKLANEGRKRVEEKYACDILAAQFKHLFVKALSKNRQDSTHV